MTKTSKNTKPVRTAKAPRASATPTASARTAPKTNLSSKTVAAKAPAKSESPAVDSLAREIAELRKTVEASLSPVASGSMDEIDALRRVLSYLFEAKTESIIRELVTIRHAATAIPTGGRTIIDPLDALLADLGATKFEAERLEHVDPLIHTIGREVRDEHLGDAVVVETLRPGFRTGRGLVMAKALVAVNRRG